MISLSDSEGTFESSTTGNHWALWGR